MNVFDIIGPVMIGPSSSHSAGAVRIGRVAGKLLGEKTSEACIKLHGSFAYTYKGHGTDKAIIAGILGMAPDDLRIRNSLEIADKEGLKYSFQRVELKNAHPNTTMIELSGISGKRVSIIGSSIGGGNIVIKQINSMDVEFSGQYNTLIILHEDTPGMIASVTNLLGSKNINIAFMKVFRSHKGGKAVMIIETDNKIENEIKKMVGGLPRVLDLTVLEPV